MEKVARTSELNNENEQVNNQKIYDKKNENDNDVREGLELQTENTHKDISKFGKDFGFYDLDNSATENLDA